MKTLYLDCGMGAAGDMLTAALVQLLPDPQAFVRDMNALGIPGMTMSLTPAVKCGITGGHISVSIHGVEEESLDVHGHEHHHEHHHDHDHDHHHDHDHGHHHAHSSLHDIEHIVRDHLQLPEKVREDVLAVYTLIAEAESVAHNMPVTEIHFHEVGTLDAITDVTAVCWLMDRLAPDQVIVSPIHVGCGQVHCAHGILPVPAPATAYLLRDIPIYGGKVEGELCTPTGAALLRHFATRFGDLPVMRTQSISYGMGTKDFPAANCVRAMLGTTEDAGDEIAELSCNVDDMTGEQIAFACQQLMHDGALDVFTQPIGMKKGRPGTLISLLCPVGAREEFSTLLFRYTTTLGVRVNTLSRYILSRTSETVNTPLGPVRRKTASGYGVTRSKYEYEDLAALASARGCSLQELLQQLEH